MFFFSCGISPSQLVYAHLKKIHEIEGKEAVTEEDIIRMFRSANFILDTKEGSEFAITGKPATKGCEQAVQYRFDLKRGEIGVGLEHEVKSLLYMSKDGKTLYYFLMPGTTDLPKHVNDFAAPLTEEQMKEYGLIPYTVNPGTFLQALMEKQQLGLKVEIHVDQRLCASELGFVTNNCGSRYVSCSMDVAHFNKALDRKIAKVREKHGDRVCASFHDDLSDFAYRPDRSDPYPSVFPTKVAKFHQMMVDGDHYRHNHYRHN